MDFSIEQAKTFCEVIRLGSYTKTAESLSKSHSSIVYAIKGLEQQCGLELFDRNQYRSTLTPAGERIHEQCQKLLRTIYELENLCDNLNMGWEPTIRLVYDGILSADPFLQLLTDFQTQQIPTRIQIYSEYLSGVEEKFKQLSADFMISVLPPKNDRMNFIDLAPLRSYFVCHQDHPLANNNKNSVWSFDDLKRFHFLTVRGADQNLNLGTEELQNAAAFHLSDFSFKKNAILQKAGFGWMPEYMIQQELADGSLKIILWEQSSVKELHPKLYFADEKLLGKAGKQLLTYFSESKKKPSFPEGAKSGLHTKASEFARDHEQQIEWWLIHELPWDHKRATY